ncbi:MAG: hypothetical protein WAL73_20865, partial [Terracidiphilus sp.]
MSAALQIVDLHATAAAPAGWFAAPVAVHCGAEAVAIPAARRPGVAPLYSLAFYRKHTEKMLRRYLYASMLVGRAPAILNEPLNRGLVSSRPVRSFEDAVIFVLDMENCLGQLKPLDRLILGKIVLQEYTHGEAALLLGIGDRALENRLGQALDRLTQALLDTRLLMLP